METGQPLPRLWLMTDERIGDGLLEAVERLPEAAGIVFRHYGPAPAARRALFDAVRRRAGRRMLLLAGSAGEARAWGAGGSHGRGAGALSASAPDLAEVRAAEAAGTGLIFLSPVFATRSHPGALALGPAGFDALAAQTKLPAVALGGMDESRSGLLERAYGWAAIDAWLA